MPRNFLKWVIELVEGHFEYDNGLYTEDQTAPSWWDAEEEDFESITLSTVVTHF